MFHVKQVYYRFQYYFFISSLLFLNIYCSDNSINRDYSSFNKQIQANKEIKSAKEVMNLYLLYYYNNLPVKGEIFEENLTPGRYRVTFVRTEINNEPIKAEKLIMVVKYDGVKWKVITVENSWICKNSEQWGTEKCF